MSRRKFWISFGIKAGLLKQSDILRIRLSLTIRNLELKTFSAAYSRQKVFSIFSPESIRKYIERLNPRKSPGMDHIHPFVVKSCADAFSEALSVIFSRSFISSRIPDAWRLAQISPIFKKGSRSSPGNYRPISLTSVPCKLMERIVRDVMMEHLYSNNAIAPEQHGFVLRKSVVTNLLETVDRISDGLVKTCMCS